MNSYRLIKETLKYLQESRYCNLVSPQGWGVGIEGMHAFNPNNRIVYFIYTDISDSYIVSDGLRVVAIPRSPEKFQEEDPNEVFFQVNNFEHHYRLEWNAFSIPSAYLEWVVERIQEFLYPFDQDVLWGRWSYYRLWWAERSQVEILIAHPRLDKFDRDGKAVFEKNYRIKESDASENASDLVPYHDDLVWDGEE